jgi:ABC-type branched-subunit amino acid transport system ATPase component
LLQVDRLTAGYTRLPVTHEVSIRAEAKSIVAVLGPNGSGKSTLLKAMAGLLKPMSGSVIVDGTDMSGWPAYRIARSGVGYVPQLSNVFPSLTIVENLEMGGYTLRGDVQSHVERVLDLFPDLAAGRRKKAGELSGGQRNLLGVARALMLDPKVLLVDEPTAGLAPGNASRMWEELIKIAQAGAAVVVVEQNVDVALRGSKWAYVLVTGTNRLDGPSSEVIDADLHAIFLGQQASGVDRSAPQSLSNSATPVAPKVDT